MDTDVRTAGLRHHSEELSGCALGGAAGGANLIGQGAPEGAFGRLAPKSGPDGTGQPMFRSQRVAQTSA
ncbi:hypothetical protein J7399_15630 [Shimia sp. R9_1]|uniref:hypothetical protein n=1 Tax=unclassified Shimia TaxID=2630038 RepID=UPI001AD9B5A9|nr:MULTISPECIES: hypothetical protein [unclassified Shimia]MBO9398950.1 hypothetical protein [Shimia sp. R9_2]MBO9408867.1 hypothetical protein [Shimia sp. R9_1]